MKLLYAGCKFVLTCSISSFVAATVQAQVPSDRVVPTASLEQELKELELVHAGNVEQYKAFFLSELYDLVKAAHFQVKIVKELGKDWKPLPPGEKELSERVVLELAADNSIKQLPALLPKGPLFDQEASALVEAEVGARLLWNLHSLLWSQKIIKADFVLIDLATTAVRQFKARLRRVYPRAVSAADQTAQLWREKLSLLSPAAARGHTWLTFRFFGEDDDLLWVFSPAISKTRQLSGANRSDGFVGSAISPDDFFTWSGRPEGVRVVSVRSQKLLFPFLDSAGRSASKVSGCRIYNLALKPPALNFSVASFDRSEMVQPLAELLAGFPALLREVQVVELSQVDPYSLYGRQLLYIDRDTNLPLAKTVFDRAGRPWKSVITVWGVGVRTGTLSDYFPAVTLVFDRVASTWLIAQFESVSYCSSYDQESELAKFDPSQLNNST